MVTPTEMQFDETQHEASEKAIQSNKTEAKHF